LNADEQEPSIKSGSTLYIKNISFSTTQEKFTSVFKFLPSFSFARIQMKPDPNRPGGRLSMGYGFVGFKDVDAAKKALKSTQGFVLDGHTLHVSFAGRGAEEDDNQGRRRKEVQEQDNEDGREKCAIRSYEEGYS
jgi:multiple RNA-binding domain-containing protein 1